MSKLMVGKDFIFKFPSETNKQEGYSIELLSGNFAGVSYKYKEDSVKVEEDEENGSAFLSFLFDVVDSNGIENLEQNEDFKNTIGDVLMSIILEGIKSKAETVVKDAD